MHMRFRPRSLALERVLETARIVAPRLNLVAVRGVAILLAVCVLGPVLSPVASAEDLFALSREYSNDTFEAISALALPASAPQWARVDRIVERLSAELGEPGWTVVVYQEGKMPQNMDVSAFALPGKRIVVSDWEATTATDDSLAFMIAHEMGHVELGHQMQTWQLIVRQTGIVPRSWTDLAKHAEVALPLMRQQEYEADKFGYSLAQMAGFDAAAGARGLLRHLADDPMHPSPADREAALAIVP
jgi:Zn-dependent protease with chaperone function